MILASQVVKEGYVFVVSTDYEYFMATFRNVVALMDWCFQLFAIEKKSSIKTRSDFMTSSVKHNLQCIALSTLLKFELLEFRFWRVHEDS